VLYYGDEIGMGDNIWLGDRDGVRTPLQWTPDRNAGFSTCNPARLYLPLIMDPIYGYQAVNIEAQQENPGSLLHWTRKMIDIRKQHPVFGLGTYVEMPSSNPSVLAFVREFGDDRVLCVNNLSRFPQPVELDLRRFEGCTPIECMGGVPFPRVGELPYLLTMPGHGFYWFQLPPVEGAEGTGAVHEAAAMPAAAPVTQGTAPPARGAKKAAAPKRRRTTPARKAREGG
jgi:maltose alpha-D-glucosyltransferase/alpha-amylase